MKSTLNLQLQGFPAANRDAEITLVNTATGQTVKRTPFLDGFMSVRDLDPGMWELAVTHPNLINPIYRGKVRLFPQPAPTYVPIPIREVVFRDSPIRDVPDANLGPVQQALKSAGDSLGPIGAKAPGEVIRAADWNTLVGAVKGLADGVLEMTRLVSPVGHDHPEIAEKIAEVQENIRSFSEAFGKSLLEFRRELEAEALRNRLDAALGAAGAAVSEDKRKDLNGRVNRLVELLQADTTTFTGSLVRTGNSVLTAMAEIIADKPELQDNPDIRTLQVISQQYVNSGVAISADAELNIYNRTGAASGGKISTVIKR